MTDVIERDIGAAVATSVWLRDGFHRPPLMELRSDVEHCISNGDPDEPPCPCHPGWVDIENCYCEGLHTCDNWEEA